MPQPSPPPPSPEPPPKPATPRETPPPRPEAAPKPADEETIFHALLDAGVGAVVAYTAEKRLHTMISETVAPQFRRLTAEMNRRFNEQDRRFDQIDRRFEGIDRRFEGIDHRLDEHDRKLDVIVARLDGFKLLGQIMIGAYALLITVLIAVFGFLFTNLN